MLTIQGAAQRMCDGWRRRDFLRVGAMGALGLSLPTWLQRAAGAPPSRLLPEPAAAATLRAAIDPSFGRAQRAVLLFLTGGPPQLDTWDLKPDAPVEIRGELKPIATSVPGIQISELFERLARHTDKFCILRSVTHHDTVHTSAGYSMLTGAYHPRPNETTAANIQPTPNDHPHLGAIVAKARPAQNGLPPFVSLPEIIRDAGVNTFPGQDAGFLGQRYSPFLIHADSHATGFEMPVVYLPDHVTAQRLEDRRVLLDQIDRRLLALETSGRLDDVDSFYRQAFAMLRSPRARQAFELDREPDAVRQAYGKHLFGQGCLLARRLLEAGVGLVTVYWHYEGPYDSPVWDTHENNFSHLRSRLIPPTDQALASLLSDLSARGMLDDTLFVCMGEFGRTPRINRLGGRDHWPFVQSLLMAGAGIHPASVYGASDRRGAYPDDQPVTPPDLAATMLHLLGVAPDLELRDRLGQPVRASKGVPMRSLFT